MSAIFQLLMHPHCKKGYRFSRPQPGCHLPNSPWPGIIKIFLTRRAWLVTSRMWTGKSLTFFNSAPTSTLQCCQPAESSAAELKRGRVKRWEAGKIRCRIWTRFSKNGLNFWTGLWPLRFPYELLKNWNFDRYWHWCGFKILSSLIKWGKKCLYLQRDQSFFSTAEFIGQSGRII